LCLTVIGNKAIKEKEKKKSLADDADFTDYMGEKQGAKQSCGVV